MTVPRRTQAERSASTRALLIDAAVDSLVERGWAATTAVEVCARAGVTRGAFGHHFSSLPELLAAALQAVYDDAVERVGTAPTSLAGLVDATWRALTTPRAKAIIEAWLAMANDPDLATEVGPVVIRFAALVAPQSAAKEALADDERRVHYLLAREAMLGLALGRATNGGQPLGHEQDVLGALLDRAADLDARDA